MRSRASSGSTARTCSSSPAPTSTASRCSRRRTPRASRRSELADRNSQRFREMIDGARTARNDDFIRTTEPRHHRASQEIWRRMAGGRRHLSRHAMPAGTRCATRPISTRSETTLGADGVRREPLGSPVEWVEEESYFFRLSAYQDRLLAHYEAQPGFHRPARAAQRGRQLRQGGPQGPLDLAHHLRLGHPGAGRPEARDVCLGRRADQLHHRRRLSRRRTRRSGASGRPTCTSSARTSCASTPSTGRPS